MQENYTSNDVFKGLWEKYNLSEIFILELFSVLQMLWFIDWVDIQADEEALNSHLDWMDEIKSKVKSQQAEKSNQEDLIVAIHYYLSKIKDLNFIKDFNKRWEIGREKLKEWLFRLRSFNDKDISKYSVMKFLEETIINLKFIDKFFDEQALDMMTETWWLPVDDIEDKDTTKLSKNKFLSPLGNFSYVNKAWEIKELPLHIRVAPWFSPLWILVSIWMDFRGGGNKDQVERDNYTHIVWFTFEKKENWSIVPVFHTLQNSWHNIGFDNNWNIVFLREPMDEEEKKNNWLVSLIPWDNVSPEDEKYRKKIINMINKGVNNKFGTNNIFWYLVSLISEHMWYYWFLETEIINFGENKWLMWHNNNRDMKSLEESWKEIYEKPFEGIDSEESWSRKKFSTIGFIKNRNKLYSSYENKLKILEKKYQEKQLKNEELNKELETNKEELEEIYKNLEEQLQVKEVKDYVNVLKKWDNSRKVLKEDNEREIIKRLNKKREGIQNSNEITKVV